MQTIEQMRADKKEAEKAISEILTSLSEKYNVMINLNINKISHSMVNGATHIYTAELSINI